MKENRTEKNSSNCFKELEKYKVSLDFLKFEAIMLWQIFSAFFIGNTLFFGLISNCFIENKQTNINYSLVLIFGIIGLFICIPWLGTFYSNSKWYYFRMDQAKADEKKLSNFLKDDWYLLNKKAEIFSKNFLFKNKYAGYILILIFMIFYLSVIFFSVIKLTCICNL